MTFEKARTLLAQHGQEQILAFWGDLDSESRTGLLRQVAELDFTEIAAMQEVLRTGSEGRRMTTLEPADVVEMSDEQRRVAFETGAAALGRGEAGVILVAGGQGSRLGYDGPKGCYPIGPVSDAPLFYFHARKVLALERRWGCEMPLYIMTSPDNDQATREFFEKNSFFGLVPERVFFFRQAMWPALDSEGRIILDAPGSIFMGPDGHGGMLAALARSGCLADMGRRNLKAVFYLQVDNPLVEICDPTFMGEHLLADAEFSLKVCSKRDPDEGLGMVVRHAEGGIRIVEYSELSQEEKNATRPDGRLRLLYGSVAIHIFATDFLRRVTDTGLPLHAAYKKVPVCDAEGRTIQPERPNAYKFEKFIFDALAEAERTCCVAFERAEEFSPVKNAEGEDSPRTCRRDLSSKWARWLREAGIPVELDAQGYATTRIEVDPCYALDAEMLSERLAADKSDLPHVSGDVLLRD